jgi:hypothetical protein
MAFQFKVVQVYGSDDWQSDYGPMKGWKLVVQNLTTGQSGYAEINSKPDNAYKEGDTFWADIQGERAGVPKLKRVQPPRDGQGAAAPSAPPPAANPFGAPAPASRPASTSNGSSGPVPYSKALVVYRRFADDLSTPEHATTMFLAWLKGQVSDPPPDGIDRNPPPDRNSNSPF